MKVLVFENGELGRRVDIPGENVRGELEELLGGPIVWERLGGELQIVTREDTKAAELPVNYVVLEPWYPTEVRGNAAVVKVTPQGGAKDVTKDDAERVNLWLTRL